LNRATERSISLAEQEANVQFPPVVVETARHARVSRMRRTAYAVLILACAGTSVYEFVQYRAELRWAGLRARQVVTQAHAVSTEQQVHALADYVKNNVRFEDAPYTNRPFLRASAKDILSSGRGYCGEATRAFVVMASTLNIPSQRINLHGPTVNHVVPEVEVKRGHWVLVDIQRNPVTNAFLDPKWRTLDESMTAPESPFVDYSNINLRRVPLLSHFVRRVKLQNTELGWILENPELIMSIFLAGMSLLLIAVLIMDRILIRLYSRRLGVEFVPYRNRA
jgi:hypothetical protein